MPITWEPAEDGGSGVFIARDEGPVHHGVSYTVAREGGLTIWILEMKLPLTAAQIPRVAEAVAQRASSQGVRLIAPPPVKRALLGAHAELLLPHDHPAQQRSSPAAARRPPPTAVPEPTVRTVSLPGVAEAVEVSRRADGMGEVRCRGHTISHQPIFLAEGEWLVTAYGDDGALLAALLQVCADVAEREGVRLAARDPRTLELLTDARHAEVRSDRGVKRTAPAPKDVVRFCRLFDRVPTFVLVGETQCRRKGERVICTWQSPKPQRLGFTSVETVAAELDLAGMRRIRADRGGTLEVVAFVDPARPDLGRQHTAARLAEAVANGEVVLVDPDAAAAWAQRASEAAFPDLAGACGMAASAERDRLVASAVRAIEMTEGASEVDAALVQKRLLSLIG